MKQIGLAAGFIKKSIFSYVLLFIIIHIAVFYVHVCLGYLEYKYYGIGQAEKYLSNADYVMEESVTFDLDTFDKKISNIEKYDGVKSIIYRINGNAVLNTNKDGNGEYKSVIVLMYSKGYMDYFKESLDLGNYPKQSIINNKYQCMTNLDGVNDGDSFYIFPIAADEGEEIELLGEIEITGKFYYGGKFLNTTVAGNIKEISTFFCYERDVLVMPYNKDYLKAVRNYMYSITGNYYIIYEDGISNEQKQYIREEVIGDKYFIPISEALEQTLKDKKSTRQTQILIPMLAIYLSAMMFIVVYVISAYKYMKEFSIYYIVGSTKKKIMGMIHMSMIPIAVSAIIFSLFLIKNYEKIDRFKIDLNWDIGFVMYNSFITYIIFFLLALVFISNIIVMVVISRMSPVKFYRQLNN